MSSLLRPAVWRGRSVIAAPLLVVAAVVGAVTVGAVSAFNPLLGVLVVVVVAFGLVVLEHPSIGVLVCFAVVPFTAGLRRGLPVPGLKLSEVVLLATVVLVLGVAGRTRRWTGVDHAVAAFAVCGILLTGVNIVRNSGPVTLDAVRSAAAPVMFFLLYRLVRVVDLSARQRRLALGLLIAPACVVVLVALGQRFDVPGVRAAVVSITGGGVFDRWSYLNTDVAARATGLFEIWHSLAGYLVPLFLLCVALLNERRVTRRWKQVAAVMLGVTLVGLLASQTLNALAAAVGGALVVGLAQRRFGRTAAALLVVSLVGFLLVGDALSTRLEEQFSGGTALGQNVEDRLEIWADDYADPMARYWALGYGPNLPPSVDWDHTESLYVTLMLRGGVVLTGAFLLMWLVIAVAAWVRRTAPDPMDRVVAVTVFATVLTSLVMNLIFPYVTSSGFPQVFWMLVGLLPVTGRPGAAPVAGGTQGPQQLAEHRTQLAAGGGREHV